MVNSRRQPIADFVSSSCNDLLEVDFTNMNKKYLKKLFGEVKNTKAKFSENLFCTKEWLRLKMSNVCWVLFRREALHARLIDNPDKAMPVNFTRMES